LPFQNRSHATDYYRQSYRSKINIKVLFKLSLDLSPLVPNKIRETSTYHLKALLKPWFFLFNQRCQMIDEWLFQSTAAYNYQSVERSIGSVYSFLAYIWARDRVEYWAPRLFTSDAYHGVSNSRRFFFVSLRQTILIRKIECANPDVMFQYLQGLSFYSLFIKYFVSSFVSVFILSLCWISFFSKSRSFVGADELCSSESTSTGALRSEWGPKTLSLSLSLSLSLPLPLSLFLSIYFLRFLSISFLSDFFIALSLQLCTIFSPM